ncbi:P-loop NTPase family protein [Paracoccus aminophilus]|uniref:DnaA-like protein n=1 Tax=Paracoccus aminophilus JCM 7686 TaxID=1367847 RepID=S5XPB9_PARAH|nr:DnaA/Hda family protein [Paracoccus aminophilus]AGT09174.1 DnaA-like protein [Paracoccus aminophilus JCM 7686]
MARQLTFDLAGPPASARADFLVTAANRDTLAMLDRPEIWPRGRLLLLGAKGSGKSHIARFWAAENGALRQAASGLRIEALDGVVPQDGALVIENAHRLGTAAGAEQAMFHLANLAEERSCLLLLTALRPPRDWGIILPDLRSRMESLTTVELAAPDEALLPAVLVKLFADRQIAISPEIVDYLALRMDRDLDLARRLVAAIDMAALADHKAITRRLAAEWLDKLFEPDA